MFQGSGVPGSLETGGAEALGVEAQAAGGALGPAAPLLPIPRPAGRLAARGRQDSLHVASAATIQPLIER